MAKLTIPEAIQPGLKQLRDLSKSSAQELLDTLRTEKPSLRGDDYASSVAKKVTNIPPDAIKQIITSLISLYSARHYFELAKEDLASEVAKAPALIGTGTQQKKFEGRLVQFFDVEAISVTSKAFDILSSHENTLTSVRVLTDIRPIFSEDDNEPPTAAVVVHTIKISYRKNDEYREFFVAMDKCYIP